MPDSFQRAIRPDVPAADRDTEPIDVELARRQHEEYRAALERSGLTLIPLPADERYPDCPFVEDAAVVIGDTAIVPIMGAESRRGETVAAESALSELCGLRRLRPPATLDGGDVLVVGRSIFVGLSSRTNAHAVRQLRELLGAAYRIVPVPVRGVLHLKSACSHLGGDTLVICPDHVDPGPFETFHRIPVEPEHVASANCLAVNGIVYVPAAVGPVAERIEAAGFETHALNTSEARKAGAGLTCSCILLDL